MLLHSVAGVSEPHGVSRAQGHDHFRAVLYLIPHHPIVIAAVIELTAAWHFDECLQA
jgi:hypothetical protein